MTEGCSAVLGAIAALSFRPCGFSLDIRNSSALISQLLVSLLLLYLLYPMSYVLMSEAPMPSASLTLIYMTTRPKSGNYASCSLPLQIEENIRQESAIHR